jgi:hypothetical protein
LPIPNLSNSTLGPELIAHNTSSKDEPSQEGTSIFGEDGFTFGDILDIVNPLQHIPIVGMIYRKITGDTIAPAMQIAGGALFGGPLGAAMSAVTTVIQSHFNEDSTDPNSPYMDKDSTTINPSTVANNTSQPFPKTISSNDYSLTNNSSIKQTNYTDKAFEKSNGSQYGGSIGPSISMNTTTINKEITIDKTNDLKASFNPLRNKHAYQPADGIVNLAYKDTENYTNIVTSTNTPANSIDVIIGSSFGPG